VIIITAEIAFLKAHCQLRIRQSPKGEPA